MGFMDWLMKGVDEPEVNESKKATFDEKTLENLRNLSSSEKQEKTTINGPMNHMQVQGGYMGTIGQGGSFVNQAPMQPQMQFQMQGQQQPMQQSQPTFSQGVGAMPYGGVSGQTGGYAVQNMGMPAYGMQGGAYMQPKPTEMIVFKVFSEEDIKSALKHLAKKSPCVISFERIGKKKKANLYQFLSGGVYALGASMVKWIEDEYLLAPRGMEISRQDKAKRK